MQRTDIEGVSVATGHLVDGRRIEDGESFEVRSPLDWSWKLADMAAGGEAAANAAVEAAVLAAPGWAKTPIPERAALLHRLADLIDDRIEDIAKVECVDMGMLLESLRARVIHRGAENFRNYADLMVEHRERTWSSKGTDNRVIRMPAGPAVIITPWNAPWLLSTWKLAPALAAGNPVVLKPAEWAPLSASLLGDLVVEAGFPPGVFNLVQGSGEEAGAALASDPRIRRISFTGSPETGRLIGAASAANLVPFTAEMGGKGPFLVFDDADVEAAARMASGQFDDAGQVCLAGTRLLVQREICDQFMSSFLAHVDAHVLGDSRHPRTTISPLIHPDHLARVGGFVSRARQSGDEIIIGGTPAGGLFYTPTVIVPRSNDAEVVQREIFGPVLSLQTFDSENEGVALANSTPYGLSSIVYTGSTARAERVGRSLRSGIVWTNCFLIRDLTAPFGGCGISGIGREGGDYALDFHSDLKTFQVLAGSVT